MFKFVASVSLVVIIAMSVPAALAQDGGAALAPVEATAIVQDDNGYDAAYDDMGTATDENGEAGMENTAPVEAMDDMAMDEAGETEAAVPGSEAAIIDDCRARMVNDRATLDCVEQALVAAEASYRTAAAQAQQKAAAVDETAAGHDAVRAAASSAMAFEAFREAECQRRRNLAGDELAAHLTWLACKAEHYNARARTLAP